MKVLAGTALMLAALASNPQIRRPFKSDPPVMCAACPGWNADREPFRIYGNAYYVGTERLSSILITSERGHILLDGGLPQSAELIDRHIRRLGFRTEDVKLIVNSHAHFDHAGGIHALQHASGATVAASASGARALKQGEPTADDPQYGFGRQADEFPAVSKVRVVKDGETLHVGTLSLTAHLTPGHTPGSTTWTWKSCDESRCLDIVYADSLTATIGPGFTYSSDPARVAEFRRSIETVAALPCDIVIAVHPEFTNFAVRNGCRDYAQFGARSLETQLSKEKK